MLKGPGLLFEISKCSRQRIVEIANVDCISNNINYDAPQEIALNIDASTKVKKCMYYIPILKLYSKL